MGIFYFLKEKENTIKDRDCIVCGCFFKLNNMKKIILIIAILIPSLSWGQFNVSVNGGYLASVPMLDNELSGLGIKSDYNPIFGIKAGYSLSNFNVGIRADMYSAGFRSEIGITDKNATPIFNGYAHEKQPYYGISPSLFAEYKVHNLHLGINAGLILSNKLKENIPGLKKKKKNDPSIEYPASRTRDYKSTYYSFGIQASYQIHLIDKLSIVPEISPRIIINSEHRKGGINSYLIIPLTLGLNYQF